MKTSDTDKCTSCNDDVTIEHLLTTCKYTLPFWKEDIKWLKMYNIIWRTKLQFFYLVIHIILNG